MIARAGAMHLIVLEYEGGWRLIPCIELLLCAGLEPVVAALAANISIRKRNG